MEISNQDKVLCPYILEIEKRMEEVRQSYRKVNGLDVSPISYYGGKQTICESLWLLLYLFQKTDP